MGHAIRTQKSGTVGYVIALLRLHVRIALSRLHARAGWSGDKKISWLTGIDPSVIKSYRIMARTPSAENLIILMAVDQGFRSQIDTCINDLKSARDVRDLAPLLAASQRAATEARNLLGKFAREESNYVDSMGVETIR